jgi:Xaa-Pro dipeptidase
MLHNTENRNQTENLMDLRNVSDDDEEAHLFQEDLDMMHEEAIRKQKSRDLKIKLLIGSNITTLMACLLVAFILGLVCYYFYLNRFSSRDELSDVVKCQILEKYLKDKHSYQNDGQFYFSDQFIADMHKKIRENFIAKVNNKNIVLHLQGTPIPTSYAALAEGDPRQNRNFLYLTGAMKPGYEALIDFNTNATYLFVPVPDPNDQVWIDDKSESLQQMAERYGVKEVAYVSNVTNFLIERRQQDIYSIDYKNQVFTLSISDNGTIIKNSTNSTDFLTILKSLRDIKLDSEIAIMKKAAQISSYAHKKLIQAARTKIWEFQGAALFKMLCESCGLSKQAYAPIVATGNNTAILHYTVGRDLAKEGSLLLIDAGAEFLGYASDITRTYAIGGQFNDYQSQLYNAVLNVQEKTMATVKNGINYTTVDMYSKKFMMEELKKMQLFTKDMPVDQLLELGFAKVFRPHGLGHLVGLDVHDTTVYPKEIKKGMVITIEPGIYFNDYQLQHLDEAQSSVLNISRISAFIHAGASGVRIEDDILVTDTGFELLNHVPKTIEDIKKLMLEN